MNEELLTPEEVGSFLKLKPRSVKDLLRSGKLPGLKVGKVWRVSVVALQEYIEKQKNQGGVAQ